MADHCDEEGAKRLCARIEQYWRTRGHTVCAWPVHADFHKAMRSARFDVRSNLINGVPIKAKPL